MRICGILHRFGPSLTVSAIYCCRSGLFGSAICQLVEDFDAVGDSYDHSNPVSAGLNRVPHNIAFGGLCFWLPFVVLLTALVGGSQTSHCVPRVLENFRKSFKKTHAREYKAPTFPNISEQMNKRWICGGLPVWQPEKVADFLGSADGPLNHRRFACFAIGLSLAIVAIPTGCAMAVSWLTPTRGFSCRAMTQLSFLIMWIVSAAFDSFFSICIRAIYSKANDDAAPRPQNRELYWITLVKDPACLSATIIILTLTALGIFNKCECWCKWPKSSGHISFPQDISVFRLIKRHLQFTFPIILGLTLLRQIVIFGLVWYYFRKGHRLLKQRDIDSVLGSR